MLKTVFHIPQMDCPSEENLIRSKLGEVPELVHLDFDIPERKLTVFHTEENQGIDEGLSTLNLGAKRVSSEITDEKPRATDNAKQRKLLWTVLSVNAAFFLIEMTAGWWAQSMGLVADSLDMLADAAVYGISLIAVGGALATKKKVARWAGYFQLTLAILGFAEVVRRFLGLEQVPDYSTMIGVSIAALLGNAYCLYLLQKSKSDEEVHMKASMIFTSNDIVINSGVIAAGGFVLWLESAWPDLIIGTLVFLIVLRGAKRILTLGK